jgi:plastocyanin
MDRTSKRLTRRRLLQTAAGAGAAVGAAGSARGQQTHTVDMTDQLVFDPDDLTIAPGDTIVWENVGTIGHSVTAYEEDIPSEAEYFASGGFDEESAARSAYSAGDPESGDVVGGESYQHTFEVEATYDYFCIPHESVGMIASVDVTAGGASDDGGAPVPQVPDVAKTILIAATAALVGVVGLAYFFLKYGGDYGPEDGSG